MLLEWCTLLMFTKIVLVESEKSDIISYVSEQNEDGYYFRYSTSDGQEREETGRLKKQGDNVVLAVQGFYAYKDLDDKLRKVTYTADETGYHPLMKTILLSSTSDAKTNSLLKIANEIFTTPPTLEVADTPINRIGGAAQATLIGGGLGK